MRLTLRTLLAYMNDFLQQEDAELIGQKILQSQKAKDLLYRIRDVSRRMRLSAPAVMERGVGLDPNTVAEYLDCRLSESQVPVFEKVCMDSDMQLAEVASCYHILTVVLREPAEIDPDSRQRMYQIPETAPARADGESEAEVPAAEESAERYVDVVDAAATTAPIAASEIAPHPRAPMQDGARWRSIAGVAVLILAVVAILGVASRWLPRTPIADTGNPVAPGEQDRQPSAAGQGDSLNPADQRAAMDSAAVAPAANTSDQGPRPGAGQAALAPPPEARDATTMIAPPGQPSAGQGPAATETHPGQPLPGGPPAIALRRDLPGVAETPPKPTGAERTGPPASVTPSGAAKVAAIPVAQQLGVYESPREVLLRINPKTGGWQRLADRAVLVAQDRLLSLPAFRPQIMLLGKIRLELVDATALQLLPASAPGIPGLAIESGRLILKPEAADSRVRLQFGDQVGVVTFQAAESVLVVEAGRTEAPGKDPETEPGPLVADLYVASGKLVWQEEPNGRQVPLSAPDHLALGERARDSGPRQLPRWASASTASPLDQRAAYVLDRAIVPERSATLELRQQLDDRRQEVHKLALRSLVAAGDFEPILKALDDPDEKAIWADCIPLLKAAVTRGPQSAALVRTAMEKRYGPDGANLYALLWKYHPETVHEEETAQLVDYLNHDRLTFRVMGWWNLKSITGLPIIYKPEDTALRREAAIRKWRERLQTNPTTRGKPAAGKERPPLPPPRELLEGDAPAQPETPPPGEGAAK